MDNPAIPRWGEVFDTDYISAHNRDALMREATSRPQKLTRREKKQLERKRKKILKRHPHATYKKLVERYNDLKTQHKALPRNAQNVPIAKKMRDEATRIFIKITDTRNDVLMLREINDRLKEHGHAVEIDNQEKRDKKIMRREASYFAGKIVERYSQLKYRELIYRDGKEYRYKVRFEAVYILPTMIVYKIDVNRLTLLGANRNNLPEGVRVADLTAPNTLIELQAACQRRVWSPHNSAEDGGMNYPFHNGAFICVDRSDLVGQMPSYIELNEVLESYRHADKHRYPIPIGVTADKKVHWAYLANTPHMMVTGLTGVGKSNTVIVMLATLTQKHSPSELQVLITDMKQGGDFREFANIPHNMADGIIFTASKLGDELAKVVAILQKRQRQIGDAGCRNIIDYNVRHEDKIPRILVVIDEYSQTRDFNNPETKKRIDYAVDVIARLGRASGIHLLLGNQQSYVKNMPSEVKSNITLMMVGYQMSLGASLSGTGTSMATKIDNLPGRMILMDGLSLMTVQVPYATEQNVADAVARAMEWERPVVDGDTEPITVISPQLSESDVIRIAIKEFEGIFAVRRIWERYTEFISRPRLIQMVNKIVENRQIESDGVTYEIIKYKKGWQLKPISQNDKGVDDVVLDVVSSDLLAYEEIENA